MSCITVAASDIVSLAISPSYSSPSRAAITAMPCRRSATRHHLDAVTRGWRDAGAHQANTRSVDVEPVALAMLDNLRIPCDQPAAGRSRCLLHECYDTSEMLDR